jgi:hypothetical protein
MFQKTTHFNQFPSRCTVSGSFKMVRKGRFCTLSKDLKIPLLAVLKDYQI